MTNDPRNLGPTAGGAVAAAEAEAVAMGCDRVGTEHLLLGILADDAGVAAGLLREAGTTLSAARHKVREASPPPERQRERSPQRPLPTTPRADLALGRALRFSHSQRANVVTSEHLLWGVVDVEGTAGQVLRGLGVDLDQLRAELKTGQPAAVPVALDEPEPAIGDPLPCPACGVDLDGNIEYRAVATTGEGPKRAFVLWCSACGHVLGASPA